MVDVQDVQTTLEIEGSVPLKPHNIMYLFIKGSLGAILSSILWGGGAFYQGFFGGHFIKGSLGVLIRGGHVH